jgi:hypothetical protein
MGYRVIFLLIALSFTSHVDAISQDQSAGLRIQKPVHKKRVSNIIGFVPSKAEQINGWAVGWAFALNTYRDEIDSVQINGLYTNAGPLQIILPLFALGVRQTKQYSVDDSAAHERTAFSRSLNGLAVGVYDVGRKFRIQGLQVNAIFQHTGKLNGISITGLLSRHDEMNGVMITGLVGQSYKLNGLQLGTINQCSKLKGVQIGLFNRARKVKGVQIGFWNQIGKWGLPFINFRF